MKRNYSKIAERIHREQKIKEKWKERLEKEKQKRFIILDEHSRSPLIIKQVKEGE